LKRPALFALREDASKRQRNDVGDAALEHGDDETPTTPDILQLGRSGEDDEGNAGGVAMNMLMQMDLS
jgi:hypothetical protein